MKKTLFKKILIVLVALLALTAGAFLIWGLTPLGPDGLALSALESSEAVQVTQEQNWILFTPADGYQTGFIFYPGGHVDYRSYAPALHQIAAQGFLVALPRMPLSLAVLDINRAEKIMAAHPEVQQWALGGHSLGGSMAANFAYTHPDAVSGLVLWASYPAESNDLSGMDIQVISIAGGLDGVVNQERLQQSAQLLPADTQWEVIPGGNHAGFGSYGPQPGDNPTAVATFSLQQTIANLTAEFLLTLSQPVE